jgi:hypothetical protein
MKFSCTQKSGDKETVELNASRSPYPTFLSGGICQHLVGRQQKEEIEIE